MASRGLLVVVIACLTLALTDAAAIRAVPDKATDKCDSEIYCTGPLLHIVQESEIFNDSKTFVDLSQLNSPDETLNNFDAMMKATYNKPNRTQVEQFVRENFAMQDELLNVTLPDWVEKPSILKRIQNPDYRKWAYDLNQIWTTLARKITDDVAKHPEKHSLIYVKNPFIIPGGRFKEFYYWDSYWIIMGLLLCDMHQTAKGMVENFAQIVDEYGFIPNGGRVYYTQRSQPPLFISMIILYVEKTQDMEFLRLMAPRMEKEFNYWQTNKLVEIQKDGKTYKMIRYIVNDPQPRPESYREDYRLALQLPEERRPKFYNNIKAAAESGWDFSNRWYAGNGSRSLLNISTSNIIPVELNAFQQRNARMLSDSFAILGDPVKSASYKQIANEYQQAIDNVLWNENEGIWNDYDLKSNEQRNVFYPSNIAPLYTSSYDRSKSLEFGAKAVKYLKKQKIDEFMGGTPASLKQTGEQWDFPNAWPPLQSFLVIGLQRTNCKEAKNFAKELANKWLSTNYIGYQDYGKMFEKYNSIKPGQGGGGGEYDVQEGFGWTNGIVFEFLYTFPDAGPDQLQSDNNNVLY